MFCEATVKFEQLLLSIFFVSTECAAASECISCFLRNVRLLLNIFLN